MFLPMDIPSFDIFRVMCLIQNPYRSQADSKDTFQGEWKNKEEATREGDQKNTRDMGVEKGAIQVERSNLGVDWLQSQEKKRQLIAWICETYKKLLFNENIK